MASMSRRLRLLAITLSILNFGAFIVALRDGEATHALGHVAAGIALFAWSRSLRRQHRESSAADRLDASDRDAQIEGLESDVEQLRRELSEAQERLDFTERMLAQRRDPHAAAPLPRQVTPR
jgi:HAMP domain-containing protein